jgi:hypothetical protein
MADDVMNHGDDAVVDDSTDSALAATGGNGLRAGNHDQNVVFATTNHDQTTSFQSNNTERNEFMQTLAEVRRQNVVLFEQRASQSNAMFAAHMAQIESNRATQAAAAESNRAAAAAAANGLLTQQQGYGHSQASQDRLQASSDYLVSVGITTPWLP